MANLISLNVDRPSGHLPPSRLRFATWNARGLEGKVDTLLCAMKNLELDFVFVTETMWDRRRRAVKGMVDNNIGTHHMHGRPNYGTTVMLNPARMTRYPVEIVFSGEEGKVQVWRWRGCLFIGLYIPPRDDSGDELDNYFGEMIGKWLSLRRNGEPVFLLGDFNMRLGKDTGDSFRNRRANTIGKLLTTHGFTFARPANLLSDPGANSTFMSNTGGSSIVDYIYFDPERAQLGEYEVYQEEMFSDHQLVWAEFDAMVDRPPEQNIQYKTWRLIRLKDEEVVKAYQADFQKRHARNFREQCMFKFEDQAELDSCYGAAMGMILDSARRIVGETDRTKFRIPKLPIDVEDLGLQCKIARMMIRAGDGNTQEQLAILHEARDQAIHLAKDATQDKWDDFVIRMEGMNSQEIGKVTRSFKMARQGARGARLSSDDASLEHIAQHFEGTFRVVDGALEIIRLPPWMDDGIADLACASAEEVAWFIKRYPNGKSGGISGMRMELLKPLVDWIAEPLSILFERILNVGIVPMEWKRARILPLAKTDGASAINDHRPISLTEVMRKVFEKCIHPLLINWMGRAHFAQGGFEPNKGTIDQVSGLNEAMRIRRNKRGKPPGVCFLDIAKAYDSVDPNILWNRLMERKCHPKLARLVMEMFEHNRSRVVVNGRETRELIHRAGLLQGSVLSPTLYNLVINPIMSELIEANDGDPLTSFWYADDGAILAKTPKRMQKLLNVAVDFSRRNNFRFNVRKCEVMNLKKPVRIYDDVVPVCTHFKYLGVWFGATGADWFLHFSKMVEKGRKQLQFWKSIGFNSTGFGLRTRRLIFTSFLRPVVEYGLAIMPKLTRVFSMLESFQGEALCIMYGVGMKSSRAAVRGLTMITTYEVRWMELGARWEFRVVKRDETHMTSVVRGLISGRLLIRQSCFAKFGTNPILIRYAVANEEYMNLQRLLGRRYPKPLKLQVTILELRKRHLDEVLSTTWRMVGLNVDTDCKARTFYSLGRIGVRLSRYVAFWMLGRYIGPRRRCLVCKIDGCTVEHFIECCAAQSLDHHCKSRRWADALPLIQKILNRADGLDLANLRLDPPPTHVLEDGGSESTLRIYT